MWSCECNAHAADGQALSGTLGTARRQGVVAFEGETLFQGAHDAVLIKLLRTTIPDSNETTCRPMYHV